MRRRVAADVSPPIPWSIITVIFFGTLQLRHFVEWIVGLPLHQFEAFWIQPVAGGLSLLGMMRLVALLMALYVVCDFLALLQESRGKSVFARLGHVFAFLFLVGLQGVYWRVGVAAEEWGAAKRVPVLARQLEDGEFTKRHDAAWQLSYYGALSKEAVPALVRLLGQDHPNIRCVAAYALGEIGAASREAVPALTEAAASGSGRVREAARGALRKIAP